MLEVQFLHAAGAVGIPPPPDREWAGDNEFRGPWGAVRSANISPHASGLGAKTKEDFISLFRAFGAVEGEVPTGGQNTIMPWPVYNKLTDEDLGIVYDYLKAQKAGGDFNTPMLVHSVTPPGTATMTKLKTDIKYTYEASPKGGRVVIVTSSNVALAAVHEFLRFQIKDHATGDPLTVGGK